MLYHVLSIAKREKARLDQEDSIYVNKSATAITCHNKKLQERVMLTTIRSD